MEYAEISGQGARWWQAGMRWPPSSGWDA